MKKYLIDRFEYLESIIFGWCFVPLLSELVFQMLDYIEHPHTTAKWFG